MEQKFEILMTCPLFKNIEPDEIEKVVQCLTASENVYEKNSYVFITGETVNSIGIVLSGMLHIIQEDFWGNRSILSDIGPGNIFAEAFACTKSKKIHVSVLANMDSHVLFLDCEKIITTCNSTCSFHPTLIQNMISILAEKNVMLTSKMELLTKPTTKEKLLSYLSSQARMAGSSSFEITFNRQELSDFLSVDRSAMSSELSKLKNEGIIDFKKNKFTLLLFLERKSRQKEL